jgi:hypothetical protein
MPEYKPLIVHNIELYVPNNLFGWALEKGHDRRIYEI